MVLNQSVFVEVLDDVVLVGVGDGDVFIAEDDAETVYLLYHGHVYDVGTVYSQELRTGQIVFELLHAHEAHNLLTVDEVDAQIVLEAFYILDVVEGHTHQLVVALDKHETVFYGCGAALNGAEPLQGLVGGFQEVVVGDGLHQVVEGVVPTL